jgi:hypothetical protein
MNIFEKYYKRGDTPWLRSGYKTEVTIIDINQHLGEVKINESHTGDIRTVLITIFLTQYAIIVTPPPPPTTEIMNPIPPPKIIKCDDLSTPPALVLTALIVIVVLTTLLVWGMKG